MTATRAHRCDSVASTARTERPERTSQTCEPHRLQPISPNLTGPACRIGETRTPQERLNP